MKNKLFFCFLILFFIFTSCVFATDTNMVYTSSETLLDNVDSASELVTTSIYSANKENTTVSGEVHDNVFKSCNEFIMEDTASVTGNLFIVANKVTLKSSVDYSDAVAKDGSPSINKINSAAVVHGNVFLVCNELILESGSEIDGDLYVVSSNVDIQKSANVHGNIFMACKDVTLNGRVGNSVYGTTKNFTMPYYGSIANDLVLSSDLATLSAVIKRNANLDCSKLTTTSDFLVYGNLTADCKQFDFSGEVDGNASINSKDLTINNSGKCLVKGDLSYSSSKELSINSGIVNGKATYSEYVESENTRPSFSFKAFILSLLTFVAYIFVIAWIFTLINKNYLSKKCEIKVGNVFASFGIGLLAFLVVILASILLFIIGIGSTLSFALIFAYIFLLFLAMPLFVLDIANLFAEKINLYLGILLVSLVLFLIGQIPYLGGIVMFFFFTTGAGRIVLKLIRK